jgi:hypothetical protein
MEMMKMKRTRLLLGGVAVTIGVTVGACVGVEESLNPVPSVADTGPDASAGGASGSGGGAAGDAGDSRVKKVTCPPGTTTAIETYPGHTLEELAFMRVLYRPSSGPPDVWIAPWTFRIDSEKVIVECDSGDGLGGEVLFISP